MKLTYRENQFKFEPDAEGSFSGRLVLNAEEKLLLLKLLDDEDENWYLDNEGERVSAEALFSKTPWSAQTVAGKVPLLSRLLNLETGEVRFNQPANYGGESFRWMRGN